MINLREEIQSALNKSNKYHETNLFSEEIEFMKQEFK